MTGWSVDVDERLAFYYYRVKKVEVVLTVVVALEMVACGGWEERQKLVVVVASTSGLVVATRGHDRAFGVEEKLPVLRGMMRVLFGSCR